MSSLLGVNCLVTGAAGYLGSEMVKALCENGATTVAAGRNLESLSDLADSLSNLSGAVLPVQMDVTEDLSVSQADVEVRSFFSGGLHCLVIDAYSGEGGGIWEQGPGVYA